MNSKIEPNIKLYNINKYTLYHRRGPFYGGNRLPLMWSDHTSISSPHQLFITDIKL